MNKPHMYPLLVLFVFICATHLGTGLQCYVCNSKYNESCLRNPSIQYLVNCSDQHGRYKENRKNSTFTVCRYMYMNIDGQEESTDRSCGWLGNEQECYRTATMSVKSRVCQCSEDGCNTSDVITPSKHLFLVAIAMTLFTAAP
ncbi:uncharacterized protein LOC135374489 isoform X2 [Ornithodoros turicata]